MTEFPDLRSIHNGLSVYREWRKKGESCNLQKKEALRRKSKRATKSRGTRTTRRPRSSTPFGIPLLPTVTILIGTDGRKWQYLRYRAVAVMT